MNFKLLHIILKRFTWGLGVILLAMLCITNAKGQPNLSGYSDVARQRLLIRITAQYIYTVSQWQIDMDSAIRIPCKVYGLSQLLAYNEGYSDGKPSAGTSLLDAGKIKEAEALLADEHNEARIRLLLELGSYFIFKPGTAKADLNEASKYINEALMLSNTKSTKWEIESMMLQANLLNQSGLKHESQKVFARIVTLGELSGNKLVCARAFLNAGELLPYGTPERLNNFEKALSIFESQNAKEKIIETQSEINIEYFILKRFDILSQLISKQVKLQLDINFHQQQYAYDALCWLAMSRADLVSAVAYSNKSLESLRSRGDSSFMAFYYTRRATLYQYAARNEDAIAWYNKALENKTGETRLYWYGAFIGKAETLYSIGKYEEALSLLKETSHEFPPASYFEKLHVTFLLGEVYEKLRKFDLAENNYKTFLSIFGKFPLQYINNQFPTAIFHIADFYRIIGKTDQAKQLLEQGKDYASKLDLPRKGYYYYYLFEIDSTKKRYLSAIKDLQQGDKLLNATYGANERSKLNELLVKYEAEKKDKDIKLLNSQNQLERIRLKEADSTKNITLAGVALLLIIIGLLLNRYLIKQRNNRKLEANQQELEANQRELDRKNFFLETLNTEQNKLLKEKEWLIKEVHHRVKNNLQMVTSLLYSQTFYLEDDKAKVAVKDSLRRIQAMSLIHQKLYQDDNTSTIAMPEYLNDLAVYLNESFDIGNRVVFEQTIEPIALDVTQAIPLGLIVTESIVNAIKYAFLNEHEGIVSIDLRHDEGDYLLLKISDNGIGLPAGLNTLEGNSLGLDLMQGLAKQLNGTFHIENNNGVHITVRFAILNK